MISIDFDIAYRHATEMAVCANDVQHQQNKLSKIIDDLRTAWRGETSGAFVKKLEAFAEKLQKDAKRYHDDAVAFRAKIDEIKRLEEEAAAAITAAAQG